MPGEDTHALMIEVAALTRQRDDMERIGNAKIAKWQARAETAESERDAARAEVKRLREALEWIGVALTDCRHDGPALDCERCAALRARRAALCTGGDRG